MKMALSVVTLLLLSACGGGNQKGAGSPSDVRCPSGQTYDGEFCQVEQNVATAEVPAPAPQETPTSPANGEVTPTPADGQPVDPGSVPEPQLEAGAADPTLEGGEAATALSPAAPVDYAMAAQAAPVMHYLASSHLPSGARPLGVPFAGQFTAGQVLEQKVQLTAGKCYTVVAMGLPPVTEVDLLFLEEGSDEPIIRDETKGAQAVLGSRNACFKPTSTGSVSLRLQVVTGQGVAAAQVFQK